MNVNRSFPKVRGGFWCGIDMLLVSHILREEPYRPESEQTAKEEI